MIGRTFGNIRAAGARLGTRWELVPGNLRGIFWMLLMTVTFLSGQVVVKLLAPGMHPFEITFFRCFFTFAASFPFLMQGGVAALRTSYFHMHALRGLFGGLAMLGVFYGVANMPLSSVNAIAFTRPLFMIVLAVLFLGEVVQKRRWAATVVGFIGVLVILRPGSESFNPAAYAVLGSALSYACGHVILKKLTRVESASANIFFYMGVASLVTLIPALFFWTWPTLEQWVLLGLMGATSAVGQMFLTFAYRAGDATVVSPFEYSRLLWAGLFDILLFAVWPSPWTILGGLIVLAASYYIARHASGAKKD